MFGEIMCRQCQQFTGEILRTDGSIINEDDYWEDIKNSFDTGQSA